MKYYQKPSEFKLNSRTYAHRVLPFEILKENKQLQEKLHFSSVWGKILSRTEIFLF